MTDAEITAGGGLISRRVDLNASETPEETKVSPVRVCLSPKMTPTDPNGSSSTSSASEAYSNNNFDAFSFWLRFAFKRVVCRVSFPGKWSAKVGQVKADIFTRVNANEGHPSLPF